VLENRVRCKPCFSPVPLGSAEGASGVSRCPPGNGVGVGGIGRCPSGKREGVGGVRVCPSGNGEGAGGVDGCPSGQREKARLSSGRAVPSKVVSQDTQERPSSSRTGHSGEIARPFFEASTSTGSPTPSAGSTRVALLMAEPRRLTRAVQSSRPPGREHV
jgi:hypothetical protein